MPYGEHREGYVPNTGVEEGDRRRAVVDALGDMEDAKRRVYTTGLRIGVPMEVLGTFLLVERKVALIGMQLITVGVYSVLLIVLLRGRVALVLYERVAFAILTALFMARVAVVVGNLQTVGGSASALISCCSGVVVMYILAFIAFDKAQARARALQWAINPLVNHLVSFTFPSAVKAVTDLAGMALSKPAGSGSGVNCAASPALLLLACSAAWSPPRLPPWCIRATANVYQTLHPMPPPLFFCPT